MQLVQKKKIDEMVYEQLLYNIREGVWKSGQKIPSEPVLCDDLGVSRITLRSAIQRLRSIGLLDVRQGKGTFVTAPDDMLSFSDFNSVLDLMEKEFNEISALREALEPTSIRLIMEQGRRADLSAIESAYFSMRDALMRLDYEEYTRQDYQFHASTILASGNDIFIQILHIFRDQYFKYFKELNKFMFENTQTSAALQRSSMGPGDSHTMVYNYLTRKISISPDALVRTFTDGNKKNFARYLRNRERGQDGTGKE